MMDCQWRLSSSTPVLTTATNLSMKTRYFSGPLSPEAASRRTAAGR